MLFHGIALLGAVISTIAVSIPAPPPEEVIHLRRLPLPPLVNSSAIGACTTTVNPNKSGCLPNGGAGTIQSGDFLPDGKHVLVLVNYQGAPAAPDPASIYNGSQIILIKTERGEYFPNGSPWKCITCGVPAANKVGIHYNWEYPQSFRDGKRALAGADIIDCGKHDLASDACTPNNTFIFPTRLSGTTDDSGVGVSTREHRIHPDQVHLGFNVLNFTGPSAGQHGFFGRLQFNANPATGTPLAPRYDIVNASVLLSPNRLAHLSINGTQIMRNYNAITVGEARGFSGDGDEVTYVGSPWESGNIDIFATDLTTGATRRVTDHPEYCDPITASPDNQWFAIMDTRGSGRQMFLAGMRGIPPITDLLTVAFSSSTRNNGLRRFFQTFVIDRYGDRGDYFGQRVTGNENAKNGSGHWNDPTWNSGADPRWSLDSRQIVFDQFNTISPACGGINPLPCYPSKEPGGHNYRIIVASFPNRKKAAPAVVAERPDTVPWAIPYIPGNTTYPVPPAIPPGVYTLTAHKAGYAEVNITYNSGSMNGVRVTYHNFSDDGLSFLNGYENVTSDSAGLHWWSSIYQTGKVNGSKLTSPGGYHAQIDVFVNELTNNGTLTTTLDGVTYSNPESYT
ncbi:hypothetical protein ALT_1013 [Aspergillus lentulus]|uniref:Saponin hydrolase n=1 Tax=Aspergillus lentulus TaxID=293939 RepID=A0AAN6BKW4_ASPLE|nr:uncharacterized protein IFM58399_09802 [Aspergillus lentulus]KAF4153131.1 hypothetical protein CNMCM6069_001152 [Aspergillus lentulus]KAF4163284.1 hypothetical protein CNMCM6936_000961 [Aspergillus lentulus]KAF4178201.1 hypothetical protein CNMCM7927_002697 [Aspergillus lentulus]KAF4190580.1 hypothetical protein CNMCM8694_003551 [Aspergillus lentulus]KAF4200293.1 hypothetical protein CNMCM8927_003621 [Aspergillus lentulus]